MRKYSFFGAVLRTLSHPEDHSIIARSTAMLGCPSPDRQARQPGCRRRVWDTSLVALLCLLFMSGCYWLKYGKLMRTHMDLLVSMAEKMSSLLEDRRAVTPAMMNEFSYPLARARDFARIVGRRYAARRSLQAFNRFLDVYAGLVAETDRLRVLGGDVTGFRGRVGALREQGTEVKALLAEEGL